MKKVLFVATVVKKHINQFHLPYIKWFHDQGYVVHVFAHNDFEIKEECIIPNCDAFIDSDMNRNPLSLRNLKSYNQLRDLIYREKYDLIHCHTPVGGLLTRIAARKSRKNGTKVIYTAHGFHFYRGAPLLNWIIYYPIERLLANFTDAIITINNEDYNRANKFNCSVYFTHGIGVTNRTSHFSGCVSRSNLGIKEDDIVLISVGELNKNKNHESVIKALCNLDNKKIKYLICGEGSSREILKKLIKEKGLENTIQLLGYQNNIDQFLKLSNIFIFPSIREGLSVALLEAMSKGLFVCCSNIRGNKDLVVEGENGIFLNPKDINSISNQIEYSLKYVGRDLMTFNSSIISKYEISEVLIETTNIYRGLL